MRSKYLKLIVSFLLSVVFYALILPVFIFVRDVIGVTNEAVFSVIQFVIFLFVYGLVSIFVEVIAKRLNDKALLLRKMHGGRDIAAEELHEDESSGLISLSISDKT